MAKELTHQRLWSDNEQTFGFIRDNERLGYKAWVLEDEFREKKIPGQMRIPALRYKLGINKVDTPLTIKHRASYNKGLLKPWFVYHIEILNVPTHKGIYIHSGIDETHTDGCQLYADSCDLTKDHNPLSNSLQAIKRFYEIYYPLIDKGEDVFLTIKDEFKLLIP